MSNEDEVVDVALDALMAEFKDLGLKRATEDRYAHRWRRETRWTRLVRWLKDHPGEEVLVEEVNANAPQRLKKRFPGLIASSEHNRFLPMTDEQIAAGRVHGRRVCDLRLMWPKEKET